jgi:hypothetical protein
VASAAARTVSTLGPVPEVPVEKDRSATRAAPSSATADVAEARAISASSLASGATFTAQSAKISSRPTGKLIRKKLDGVSTPSAMPTLIAAASITLRVALSAPATITSASPADSIAPARIKGRASIRRASASLVGRASSIAATSPSCGSASGTISARPSAVSRAAASATRGSSSSGITTRALRIRAVSKARSRTVMPPSIIPKGQDNA